MPTTAEQAIKLVREGKAQFTEEWFYLDNPSSAVLEGKVHIPATNETVFIGEKRASGVQVIAGTLRGRESDTPPVYEDRDGNPIR